MESKISRFYIIDKDHKSIFDSEDEYIIPLYQRAFAWGEKELSQLIEDVNDISEEGHYYIGSLVVSRIENKFEVVDGQQRLTSLYLLLNCLGVSVKCSLSFACREKSNYTLKNISRLMDGEDSNVDSERVETGINNGIKILEQKLIVDGIDKEILLRKLQRVILYRIEVPEHTDLNRYFEIMNVRGEQLEQQDILKSKLMSYLKKEHDQLVFGKVWEACSDMTGYVQMHFEKNAREWLFGSEWGWLPSDKWKDYRDLAKMPGDIGNGAQITDIIAEDFEVEQSELTEDDNRVRFESVIEYPYFLLHAIRVFVDHQRIVNKESGELLNELLDDKKLLSDFDEVIKNGYWHGNTINDESGREKIAKDFVIHLLRCRFLFDKYVIKREYVNDNSDGEWSLKELCVSDKKSKKKPYYRNTYFITKGEHDQENRSRERVRENIMLQSALRVSYTSPKVMHWITKLLGWLTKDEYNLEMLGNYEKITRYIAVEAVSENFFKKCKGGEYTLGVNTPHIVFNFLDYLLWKENKEKYKDFVFEFRNSVEHWYPQHPSSGSIEKWPDGVDTFGNLCIIQRNVNSKFSNMAPDSKKSTYCNMIAKGSIKLRIMAEETEACSGLSPSAFWKAEACKRHEEKMIEILENACF